jgi:hypothetical protein
MEHYDRRSSTSNACVYGDPVGLDVLLRHAFGKWNYAIYVFNDIHLSTPD